MDVVSRDDKSELLTSSGIQMNYLVGSVFTQVANYIYLASQSLGKLGRPVSSQQEVKNAVLAAANLRTTSVDFQDKSTLYHK